MDEGIITGIITAVVLGGVIIFVYIKGKGHSSKKKSIR